MWRKIWIYAGISARLPGYHHGVYLIFVWREKTEFPISQGGVVFFLRCVRDGKSCDKMPGSFPSSTKWIHLNGPVLVAAAVVFCSSFACGLAQNVFCHYRRKSAKPRSKGQRETKKGSCIRIGIRKNVNKLNVIPFNFGAVLKSLQDSILPPLPLLSFWHVASCREANCPNEVACNAAAQPRAMKLSCKLQDLLSSFTKFSPPHTYIYTYIYIYLIL